MKTLEQIKLSSLRAQYEQALLYNASKDYIGDILDEINAIRNANKNAELNIIRHSEYCDER